MSIYLDNNSTTKPNKQMLNAVVEDVSQYYGNPSSPHALGQQAKDLIDEARANVLASLFKTSGKIIFTSGGTEANQLALNGDNRYILTSEVEHSSVLIFANDTIKVNKDGTLNIADLTEKLKQAPRDKQLVISVMYANNETGVILDPFFHISELKTKIDFIYHIDAVQVYGKIVNLNIPSNADLVSISGHKVHALKGVGALYVKQDFHSLNKITKSITNHEYGYRSGTENNIGILSMGFMADKIMNDDFYKERIDSIAEKRNYFEIKLKDIALVNGDLNHRVPNTSSLYFKGVDDIYLLINILSDKGLYASAGSACSSGNFTVSKTLSAMHGSPKHAIPNGSIRFSLSVETTIDEIDESINIIYSSLEEYWRVKDV